ncbi:MULTISPECIES: tryptophan tryptophylquinone biosynthesis enzyme MauG [Methylophaga]|uniref:Methylamine utilization protein MauG n=1 Tax=Methylophaga muralis TaxID=291169 RepID=A0A1E3GSA4_9GAMM|nr:MULTISPECIES: tryptophan tryptophylquinone biosynthesis enzyme MauG [Methylophaga]ODN66907.1 Cytochrome c551 peroxidase precursor [Methylophaga muralis]THK41096.1 tryptophan tryptophylquinone biosynthesis enzyme MauG [Methylophaga sp. SB9B]
MRISSLFVFLSVVLAIQAADSFASELEAFKRPEGIPAPYTNPLTVEKAALGKTLFFDPRLSRNQEMSCATCHAPDKRWSDGRKIPLGSESLLNPRRTPSVLNSAWLTSLMWDGRADTLESQAVLPITTQHEMNYDMSELTTRLEDVEGYYPLFKAAFGDEVINQQRISEALASFQRTLVSAPSAFDRWVEGDEYAVSESVKRGFALFNEKAKCVACHASWRFTDDSFHDIGLNSNDLGKGALVPPQIIIMQHAFKTPSLRDLPENGPFMHDASMNTLEEVIKHYEKGGIQRESLSPEMKPFKLTETERDDLIAFINSLTGPVLGIKFPDIPE